MLTLACAFAGKQGRRHGLRCSQSRHLVGNNDTEHLRAARCAVGLNICGTAQCLYDRVIDAALRVWPLFAKTTDRHINEAFIARAQDLLAKAHTVYCARSEILNEHIRLVRQFHQNFFAGVGFQIKRDRFLAAIARIKNRVHPIMRGRHMAHLFAMIGLDFDDLGALVGQHHGRCRSRHHAGQIQNFYSLKRSHPIPPADLRN